MKILISLLICFLTLSIPINAHASTSSAPVYSGYTEEGTYYVVYQTEGNNVYAIRSDRLFISADKINNGYIYPNPTLYFTHTQNGIKYTGVLELQSYIHKDGITTAIYTGYVYAIS